GGSDGVDAEAHKDDGDWSIVNIEIGDPDPGGLLPIGATITAAFNNDRIGFPPPEPIDGFGMAISLAKSAASTWDVSFESDGSLYTVEAYRNDALVFSVSSVVDSNFGYIVETSKGVYPYPFRGHGRAKKSIIAGFPDPSGVEWTWAAQGVADLVVDGIKIIVEDFSTAGDSLASFSVTASDIPSFTILDIQTSAPNVISTSPSQNELAVATTSNISATFSEAMDAATINSSSFVVQGSLSGKHSGSISYNGGTMTAEFDPDFDFAASELVTVSLSTDVESASNMPMTAGYVWSFTTEVSAGYNNFVAGPNYPSNGAPTSMASADFNGDGYIDIAVVETYAGAEYDSVVIRLNDGTGTFSPSSRGVYPVGFKGSSTGKPAGLVAMDSDGDGDVDLVVEDAIDGAEEDSICIMTNSGSGDMVATGVYPVGFKGSSTGKPAELVSADLNGDGYTDLAICDEVDSSNADLLSVLLNNGAGSYLSPTRGVYPVGFKGSSTGKPAGIVAADSDGDGDIDIMVSDGAEGLSADSIYMMNNLGNGVYYATGVYPVGYNGSSNSKPNGLVAADLDGDGDGDLAVVGGFAGEEQDSLSILFNDGSGAYSLTRGVYPVGFKGSSTGKPAGIVALDIDDDDDIDIMVHGGFVGAPSDSVAIAENGGNGDIVGYGVYPVGFKGSSTGKPAGCVADYDGDGSADYAVMYDSGFVVMFNQEGCHASGDVNNDGTPLTIGDVAMIVDMLFACGPIVDSLHNCNLNGDGVVDSNDILVFQDFLTYGMSAFDPYGGYPVSGPCEPVVQPVPDSAVAFGIQHVSLGTACMEMADDTLKLSRLGSSGEDGVTIDLQDTYYDWLCEVSAPDVDSFFPPGAYTKVEYSNSVAKAVDQIMGYMKVTKVAGEEWELNANFGADLYTVEAYNGVDLVFSQEGIPAQSLVGSEKAVPKVRWPWYWGTNGHNRWVRKHECGTFKRGCDQLLDRYEYGRSPDSGIFNWASQGVIDLTITRIAVIPETPHADSIPLSSVAMTFYGIDSA
ncbi:MAG: FG-GAP-like repeat-containing protein, partial [candidate division Zixibacteria bacterium]